ncbi:unnamed protein product [Mytilus edulis]|uniref:Integrase catalytic domain-containing protein n=1 Tax=Mytilus edulis TaxID=6550 RepID=A0A8S3S2V5_MYTED|nr:unnamed protein product [Mytilus edulis]
MAYDNNLQGFLSVFQNIVNDTIRAMNNDDASFDFMEVALNRLNALWRNLGRMCTSYPECNLLTEDLQRIITIIQDIKSSRTEHIGLRLSQVGGIGRPRYHISREQLTFLVEMGFSRKCMADLLHVSVSSVKRRLRDYRILLRRRYADITDVDLDDRVRRITQSNRSLGQRMVQGFLQTEGVNLPRRRIAESLIRVDEAGVAIRWCRTIRRRSYQVSGPNALWHVDGNHKLIRWGMVIHGGIDGFSRMVTFMNLALDNKAATALEPFVRGCQEFGVPSRVRTDHGRENLDIATFMLTHRGANRGSIITGRSVHNQRIERLWRDLFQSCTNVFYQLFYFLEKHHILDETNELHLWCLHYVFVPRIRAALRVFKEGWNNHRLTSAGGKSPKQLFVMGVLSQAGQGHRGIDDLFHHDEEITDIEIENYGIDWAGPVPEINNDTVSVPRISCPINDANFAQLRREINPLEEPNGLGIDIFLRTLAFCSVRLLN